MKTTIPASARTQSAPARGFGSTATSAPAAPVLDTLETIQLTGCWRTDFGDTAYLHPLHANEALVYDANYDVWVILDCCGEISNYPTLQSAWGEFISPVGHQMWIEMRAAGQHQPDRYFAA